MGVFRREDGRRLSPLRTTAVLAVAAAIGTGGTLSAQQWVSAAQAGEARPWFAGYVDVTTTPAYDLANASGPSASQVLSFVVADPAEPCTPSWGAVATLEQAATDFDLDRRIMRLQDRGGSVTVSFGGLKHDELASACTDVPALTRGYRAVVERYDLTTIDLDLEGAALRDERASARRVAAVRALQTERRNAHEPLAVWLTLPVAPSGLTDEGLGTVSAFLSGGVDVAGVNLMTMDYGAGRAAGVSMLQAATGAATEAHRQLGVLYDRADLHQSDVSLWRRIGLTPMIGQNDVPGEVFRPRDAAGLNAFARERGIGRMSMWSLNRDRACGANYADTSVVSTACSGVPQQPGAFAAALAAGFGRDADASARLVTTAESPTAAPTDDPATSPYPIWSDTGSYLAGTRIVWHGTVYRAKWWTRGELPDDPVLHDWQTPWVLVGPVLAGETPAPRVTLPADTYPAWRGTADFAAGDRVLFEGTPYEAKWWNTGESPAAAASDPNGSPWLALTDAQVRDLLQQQASPSPSPTGGR